MSTNKSRDYLDNQNKPPSTPIEALDEDNSFIHLVPKVHHITINQNITPVITPARKIPTALLDELKLI